MRCWLVRSGEPLPGDHPSVRMHRYGTLAGSLTGKGHTVVWWTSTFNHIQKRQRFSRDTRVEVDGRLTVNHLYGGGYKTNVSRTAIRSRCGRSEVLCSGTASSATRYSARVVTDHRVFVRRLPIWLLCGGASRTGRHGSLAGCLSGCGAAQTTENGTRSVGTVRSDGEARLSDGYSDPWPN